MPGRRAGPPEDRLRAGTRGRAPGDAFPGRDRAALAHLRRGSGAARAQCLGAELDRLKIACEQELEAAHQATRFPAVIVRPSLTYGEDQVPLVLNAWAQSWTA